MLDTPLVASREVPAFRVELRPDGILVFSPRPGLVLTYEIALQALEEGTRIITGPRPTMVFMPDIARVEREARAIFASEEYMLRMSTQTALVVGSPVSRVIANFFVGLNRPQYPCRAFDDPERALAWLRSFLA